MKDQEAAVAELCEARSICTEQNEDASLAWADAVSCSLHSCDHKPGEQGEDSPKARLTDIREMAEGKGWRQLARYCEEQLD